MKKISVILLVLGGLIFYVLSLGGAVSSSSWGEFLSGSMSYLFFTGLFLFTAFYIGQKRTFPGYLFFMGRLIIERDLILNHTYMDSGWFLTVYPKKKKFIVLKKTKKTNDLMYSIYFKGFLIYIQDSKCTYVKKEGKYEK